MGIFGFQSLEPLILASLVTEDPILLLGKSGTGKTLILNRIAESLGLNHKHYNASLISFDDLIGFPFPSGDHKQIEYLPTPATLWGAESVLLDEISRCKPEIQNKFFSIVQEKKLQGISLHKLKYRWAAMNPIGEEEETWEETYRGSEPLDPALADRFSFLLPVLDWKDLSIEEQEDLLTFHHLPLAQNEELLALLAKARELFNASLSIPLPQTVKYCRHVGNFLSQTGIRFSPRRIKTLLRNITAVMAIHQTMGTEMDAELIKQTYLKVLQNSLPQRAWMEVIPEHQVQAAHQDALRILEERKPEEVWVMEFFMIPSFVKKIELLKEPTVHIDIKSAGFVQWMLREQPQRMAAFVFAVFPLLNEENWLNQEAMDEVHGCVKMILFAKGKGRWLDVKGNLVRSFNHTQLYKDVLMDLPNGSRKEKSTQLFCYLLCSGYSIQQPKELEEEFYQVCQRAAEMVSVASTVQKHNYERI